MTTHSTHLSEVSEIQRVNVLKAEKNVTTVMRPTNELDGFGVDVLKLKAVSLVTSLERYLDVKRSVEKNLYLFSEEGHFTGGGYSYEATKDLKQYYFKYD